MFARTADRLGSGALRAVRRFSSSPAVQADFTHAVIGGGVVGLAIARHLAEQRPDSTTILLERHDAVGTETSSRNSEVIHAGIYYGADSLKTRLCVRGREQLYALCAAHGVPHRRTGKWIVAQTDAQRAALEDLHAFCRDAIGVPTRWVGEAEAGRLEPAVRAEAGVLESPTTGIVDSHALMLCLLGLFREAGGMLALRSPVRGVRPLSRGGSGRPGSAGWEIEVGATAPDPTTVVGEQASGEQRQQQQQQQVKKEEDDGEGSSIITAEVLVNAAGLGAVDVHNLIVPTDRRLSMYYAKGNYFSYAASSPRVGRLVYPAPEPGHGGLGTHLTLDLAGRIRFGPDVEWVDSPADLAVRSTRLPDALAEIRRYLPDVDGAALEPDYAGIRPKLARAAAVAHGRGFQDFVIRREEGYDGWVNLLGIESPGLTSSLAIAERVFELLYA